MPNERNIPSDKPKSVVTHTILSDGTEVSRKYQLLSVVVNKEVNRIPWLHWFMWMANPAAKLLN